MKRIVILTGQELRHTYFRVAMSQILGIKVALSVCEGTEKSLANQCSALGSPQWFRDHVHARDAAEEEWFGGYVRGTLDKSNPYLCARGKVNSEEVRAEIAAASPDVVVCYGASIIREPLLSQYRQRFLNLHLGMSPWYRGSGTNIFALADGNWHLCGVTFMHIDAGVDTGEIIHQQACRPTPRYSIHDIGCSVIWEMVPTCGRIVTGWDRLTPQPQPRCEVPTVVKRKDFGEGTVQSAKQWLDWYRDMCAGFSNTDCIPRRWMRNAVLVRNEVIE